MLHKNKFNYELRTTDDKNKNTIIYINLRLGDAFYPLELGRFCETGRRR